ASLGLLASCGRLPGQSQPAKVSRVGILFPSDPASSLGDGSFQQALSELGYVEGQNLILEWRRFGGRDALLPGFVAELVGLPVDVIVGPARQRPWRPRARPTAFPLSCTLVVARSRLGSWTVWRTQAATSPGLLTSSDPWPRSGWSCSKRQTRQCR